MVVLYVIFVKNIIPMFERGIERIYFNDFTLMVILLDPWWHM